MIQFIKDILKPEVKMTEDEKIAFDVITKLINDPRTRFEHAPLSQELVIKQKEKGIYLLVGATRIKMVFKDSKETSNTEKPYRPQFMEFLKDVLYKRLEAIRQDNIKEFFEGDIETLTNIKNKLENE